MKKEEVQHLAHLARIAVTDEEITSYQTDLSAVVSYVSAISEIVADSGATESTVGVRYNIFRKDEVTNQPEQYTEALLREMPETDGRYMKVKKILKIE